MKARTHESLLQFFPPNLQSRFKRIENKVRSTESIYEANIEYYELSMFKLYWTHPEHRFARIRVCNNEKYVGTLQETPDRFVIIILENYQNVSPSN